MWRCRAWREAFDRWQLYAVACAMLDGSYWREEIGAQYSDPLPPSVDVAGWGGDA